MHRHLIIRGLIFAAALLAAGYLLGGTLDKDWVDAHVRDTGLAGELLFIAAGGLLISVGLSRQLVAFLGGYAFSFMAGSLLGLLATLIGCMLTFYSARLFCSSCTSGHFSGRIRRINEFIRENTFATSLLFRLLPLGSNFVVNLAAGVSSVRGMPFFTGSALGYIPQTLVFTLIGSGTRMEQYWQVAAAIAMFAAAALTGLMLYRKYRHGKHSKPLTVKLAFAGKPHTGK